MDYKRFCIRFDRALNVDRWYNLSDDRWADVTPNTAPYFNTRDTPTGKDAEYFVKVFPENSNDIRWTCGGSWQVPDPGVAIIVPAPLDKPFYYPMWDLQMRQAVDAILLDPTRPYTGEDLRRLYGAHGWNCEKATRDDVIVRMLSPLDFYHDMFPAPEDAGYPSAINTVTVDGKTYQCGTTKTIAEMVGYVTDPFVRDRFLWTANVNAAKGGFGASLRAVSWWIRQEALAAKVAAEAKG